MCDLRKESSHSRRGINFPFAHSVIERRQPFCGIGPRHDVGELLRRKIWHQASLLLFTKRYPVCTLRAGRDSLRQLRFLASRFVSATVVEALRCSTVASPLLNGVATCDVTVI